MKSSNDGIAVGRAAKAGAMLLALWGVLHVWVGAEGAHQYLTKGTRGVWTMFLGGSNAPVAAYQHSTDAVTSSVQGHLALNFAIDVGGYGVLGLALAWLIWKRGSWTAYLLALVVIGLADLAFLFTQVTTGLIEANAGTVGGPVLWALACIVTPFGLPSPLRAGADQGALRSVSATAGASS
jgi:hypothetical protein